MIRVVEFISSPVLRNRWMARSLVLLPRFNKNAEARREVPFRISGISGGYGCRHPRLLGIGSDLGDMGEAKHRMRIGQQKKPGGSFAARFRFFPLANSAANQGER
jgi:hypothetical protein